MILLDSNLMIYSAKPDGGPVRKFILEQMPSFSIISAIETLGYHAISADEKLYLEGLVSMLPMIALSERIVDRAIHLRQTRSQSLGDSIIAATALQHGMALATRNVSDFVWIPELSIINPFND